MGKESNYRKELVELVSRIAGDKSLLDQFFQDLFSPQEYQDIVKRWQIVKQLDKGMSQRQIAKDLKVSVATITRGSRELLDKNGGFKQILKKYYPNNKIKLVNDHE